MDFQNNVICEQPTHRNPSNLSIVEDQVSDDKSINSIIQRIPGCPVGLESLFDIENVIVDQAKELFNDLPEFLIHNKFMILNNDNKKLFIAVENTDAFGILFYCSMRDFELYLMDMDKNIIAKFDSPSALLPFLCFENNTKYIKIESPPGHYIGKVILTGYYTKTEISVKNEFNDLLFVIKGPYFTGNCYNDNIFRILGPSEDEIGQIIGKWGGFNRECESDSDIFEVSFPKNLDVNSKLLLIGGCFLVDYAFYSWDSHGLLAKHVMKH